MIRVFLLFLSLSLLLTAANIDRKIKKTNEKLKNYDKRYKNADRNMAQSAKAILKEEHNLLLLDKQIQKLTASYNSKLESLKNAQTEKTALQKERQKLDNSKSLLRSELSRLLAQQLSLQIVLKQKDFTDKETLMRGEVFSAISRMTKEELQTVKGKISTLLNREIAMDRKLQTLSHIIEKIGNDKAYLNTIRKSHATKLVKLNKRRFKYKAILNKALAQKSSLRKELKKLHIIRSDRLRRIAEAQKRKKQKNISKTKVKKLGNSYARVKTKHYRGKKTLAPLRNYTVLRKFGPYRDPIYDIKIFNESVTLKPKKPNETVRAILNGKVVLSKKSPNLGNFVIIEHPNGMHTIYAKLDIIAPTLKMGKRIKRGAAIGRVSKALIFEITQKNYHINPLEVISH